MTKIYGADTETPLGGLKVIATNKEVIEAETFEEVSDFLLSHTYQGAILFLFNLRFDSEAILKTINNREILMALHQHGAERSGVTVQGVKIRYIPGKILSLCRNKHCVRMYDISQFYQGMTLEKVSSKFFGEHKDPIDAQRLGEEPGYYEDNKEEVKEYCRKDAELTLRAAELMKKTIEETEMAKGKLSFSNPLSQAKIAENYILKTYKYPKVPDKILDFHLLAEEAYHGGIFSTFQRGAFDQPLYSYDINSAYPLQMKDLPHWGNGEFRKVTEPEHDTKYGWYDCIFDYNMIPYADYGKGYDVEICYDEEKQECQTLHLNPKRILYPDGKRRQTITKLEYDFMKQHKIPVRFITGCIWEKQSEKYESPFAWVPDVYKRRQQIKQADPEDMRQWALKIVLNSSYGKTAQSKRGRGSLTNFFYASYITAGTRLQICNAIIQARESNVIEIATDSILTTKKVDLPLSKTLGEWSLNEYEKGLLIGSGIRQLWITDTESKTSARGLTDRKDWDMYEQIVNGDNTKENKMNFECNYLYHEKKRPIHLGEMLMHHKVLNMSDLCVFKMVSKKLNVNTDKKREWERDYETFGDLLLSKPQRSVPLTLPLSYNT